MGGESDGGESDSREWWEGRVMGGESDGWGESDGREWWEGREMGGESNGWVRQDITLVSDLINFLQERRPRRNNYFSYETKNCYVIVNCWMDLSLCKVCHWTMITLDHQCCTTTAATVAYMQTNVTICSPMLLILFWKVWQWFYCNCTVFIIVTGI
jgi:hypothetical protein